MQIALCGEGLDVARANNIHIQDPRSDFLSWKAIETDMEFHQCLPAQLLPLLSSGQTGKRLLSPAYATPMWLLCKFDESWWTGQVLSVSSGATAAASTLQSLQMSSQVAVEQPSFGQATSCCTVELWSLG